MIIRTAFICIYILLLSVNVVYAVPTSENYKLDSGIIGPEIVPIGLDSTNYTSDFVSGINFSYGDDPAPATTDSSSASTGGWGLISGPSAPTTQPPGHITALNVPLVIIPGIQSGTLEYDFPGGRHVGIKIDLWSVVVPAGESIKASLKEAQLTTLQQQAAVAMYPMALLGKNVYTLTIVDELGTDINTFLNPATVSIVPGLLGPLDSNIELGVYVWDTSQTEWVSVDSTIKEDSSVVFSLKHPGTFGIWSSALVETLSGIKNNIADNNILYTLSNTLSGPHIASPVGVSDKDEKDVELSLVPNQKNDENDPEDFCVSCVGAIAVIATLVYVLFRRIFVGSFFK